MGASKIFTLITLVCMVMGLSACKWRDDFRSRIQPQYQEQEPKPTFNEDSDDYVGDEIAKGARPDDEPELDEIDELSDIPELPDRPSSMH